MDELRAATPDEALEEVARAICLARNRDPDEIIYLAGGNHFRWHFEKPVARAVLALPRITTALELAAARAACRAARKP